MGDIKCRYNIDELIEEMEVSHEDIWELYKTYFGEMRENIDDITKCLKSNEFKKIERILHNIRGVSISLNIIDVYEAASIFNEKIKEEVQERYEEYINKLIQLVNGAEEEVKSFFNRNISL